MTLSSHLARPPQALAVPHWVAAQLPPPRPLPSDDPAWPGLDAPIYDGARITDSRGKSWSNLSAVVTTMVIAGRLEARFPTDHARLLVVLEQVGGGLIASTQASPRHGPPPHIAHPMVFVPAGTTLWLHATDLRQLKLISFSFNQLHLTELARDAGQTARMSQPQLNFCNEKLWGLARLLQAECLAEGESDRLYCDSLSLSLLAVVSNLEDQAAGGTETGGLAPRQLKRVTEHLEAHCVRGVSLKELAGLARLSQSHFCRAFKISTGMPPHQWQNHVRIRKACALLMAGSDTLADIALATGFSDQAHFTRVFTRFTGASPGAWRREHLS